MKRDEVRINKLAALLKEQSIPDIDEIRTGAEKGATALQPNDNISKLNNDACYTDNIGTVTSVNNVYPDEYGDVSLSASDVGALPDDTFIPTSNDYVSINTSQKIQAAKAIFGNDVAFGLDTTQKNLFAVISNSNSVAGNWIGRLTVGAKNKTFIMGTYGGICVLGAHAWTNAQKGTGAAWEPVYINPDGDKAVYIGGSPINGKKALMVLQNVNMNTTGTVKINRSTNLADNFKDVACWSDDVRKFSFTSISGYSASSNQMLTHDTSGNLKWVNI